MTKSTNKGYNPSDALGYHGIHLGNNPTALSTDQYTTGDALMGRLFYSFSNKYMLTASVRRDGYSAFGMMNPRATFPCRCFGMGIHRRKIHEENLPHG